MQQDRTRYTGSMKPLAVAILGATLIFQQALLAPLFAAGSAARADSASRRFDVAGGPLGQVLGQYASQADVVLSFDASLTTGRHSDGLNGSYGIAEGFARILAGSGLEVRFVDERTVLLQKVPEDSAVVSLDAMRVVDNPLGTITEQTKSYTPGTIATATRLTLTPRQTPQSITVITRQHMDDFGLNSIDDVMRHAPGVSITTYDSERTEYNVRGFAVNNFQYDGIPATRTATYSAGQTLSDMAIYDRIEILKGSTGLLTGTGTPGASFNLIRKKPTGKLRGHITADAGSWDNYRTELDVGGPLTESGNVRGRAVAAYQDKHSFQDRYEKKSTVYYGILEFDLTPDTLLTVGADYQDNEPDGSTWGGNIIYDSNGNFNKKSRSFSNGAHWSSWEQYTRTLSNPQKFSRKIS